MNISTAQSLLLRRTPALEFILWSDKKLIIWTSLTNALIRMNFCLL
jgi:hypothetical protein